MKSNTLILAVALLAVLTTACPSAQDSEQAGRPLEPDEAPQESPPEEPKDKRKGESSEQRTPRPREEKDGKSDETFRFAVIGDFGEGNRDERQMAELVKNWVVDTDASTLVTTGDNIYPEGDPQYFEDAWSEPYGWVDKKDVEVAASLGNHDVEGGESEEVMDLLGMPGPWYRERIRDAELFILDANRVEDTGQIRWLKRALRRSRAAWQITVFHQPAYSCSKHGSTAEVVREWVPLFERHGVDLVLNGHDHNYQRFFSKGITYIVTGGGGAQLYGHRACDEGHPERIEGEDEEHHFVGVFGSAESLRLVAIDDDGDVIDIATLKQ